jgi:hypothetical protein
MLIILYIGVDYWQACILASAATPHKLWESATGPAFATYMQ